MDAFELGVAGSEKPLATGDCTLAISYRDIARTTRTAGGTLRADVIATKRVFRFAYSWIPGQTRLVPDGGLGRNDLRALYLAGANLSLHLPGESGVEDVTVRFALDSWQETLLTRGGPYGWTWELSFDLEEV